MHKLKTVDDLIKCLSNPEFKGRPLCQVIKVTMSLGVGNCTQEVYFNQLDSFKWDADNNELMIGELWT